MAKLSPQELQEAKRKAALEREEEKKRLIAERALKSRKEEERKQWIANARKKHEQLYNVVSTLYEEVGKLCPKGPAIPVSDLTLDKTNKAINAVKDLLKSEEDEFASDIKMFVPAGDNPEYRDVVLTLSELRAALTRFSRKHLN